MLTKGITGMQAVFYVFETSTVISREGSKTG
jgi:hypothetical protein